MIIYQWESKQHGYINPYEKWIFITITQHGQTKLTFGCGTNIVTKSYRWLANDLSSNWFPNVCWEYGYRSIAPFTAPSILWLGDFYGLTNTQFLSHESYTPIPSDKILLGK
jgi:hypothetical protein